MKKILVSIIAGFLSMMTLANSSKFAIEDVSLYADKMTTAQIIAKVNKNDKLELLTMHHSGWSQIQTDLGDRGWVLTEKLTDTRLQNTDDTNVDINSNKTENILNLKEENKDLGLSENTENLTNFEARIKQLEVENSKLAMQLDQQETPKQVSTAFDTWISGVLGLLLGLIIGFSLSKVKRRRDSFHTINRSY